MLSYATPRGKKKGNLNDPEVDKDILEWKEKKSICIYQN